MSWNYDLADSLPAAPAIATPAPAAPSRDLDNAEILNQEATELGAQIPAEFAALLNRPDLSPQDKLALVRELVELNQSPNISEQDVASASPAIRDAAAAMKERRDEIAAAEQQLAGMMLAPVAALAVPAATMAMAPQAREASLAEALDFVRERGPDATPGMGMNRGMGMGLV